MMYNTIVQCIKNENKDPLKVAITCQKVVEKRATQTEIKSMKHLFQTIYHHLRFNQKQGADLTMIALNSDELLEWYLLQSYYHLVI